jgi:RHS repeat-associated protein
MYRRFTGTSCAYLGRGRHLGLAIFMIVALVASATLVSPAQAWSASQAKEGSGQSRPARDMPATKQSRSTATAQTAAAASGGAFTTGDVFAGLSNGTVAEFSSDGTAKRSLATGGSSYETGMCFDGAGNLYTTNFGTSDMSKFDNVGTLIKYPWVDSATFESQHPESCVIDNRQHIFVGSVDPGALREFDANGTLLKTYHPATEDRGLDWIDLSGDQCTILYTSEGSSVQAFDVCKDTQLENFATGLPEPCYALRILDDGRVAVACASAVVLLSKSGAVAATYTAASIGDSGGLFAFNLTPDNSAFWTANLGTGDVWKVRFSDGAVLTHFNAGAGVSGLAVFGEGGPVGEPLRPSESFGGGGLSSKNPGCDTGKPVNCVTGNFWHTFTDLTVPGRGLALDLNRTYNALGAGIDSPFGFGWSSSYTSHLTFDAASGDVTVVQENGSTSTFHADGDAYTAPPRVFATLTKNTDGTYSFVRHHQQSFKFSASGALLAAKDLNGYTTTLDYDTEGRLSTVTDPAGRKLSFSHNADGKITKVTDPASRTVSYSYDGSGNLTSSIDVAGGTWTFAYDGDHRMASMTDPRGGKLTNSYDSAGRVTNQTDAEGHTTAFTYTTTSSGTRTTITDPKGNVTVQDYTAGELTTLTKGSGTSMSATWNFAYDQYTLGVTAVTDPNGNVTRRSYGPNGELTSVIDPLGRTISATYNRLEEPLTITDPVGTTIKYAYDSDGNLTSVSRPLTETGSTQTTELHYGDSAHPGDVTALTDPVGKTWRLTYGENGDLTATIDPLSNKTTHAYDSIGRRTSTVSPRGNTSGSDPGKHTTTYAYDDFGDLIKATDPLGHASSFTYDPNRNPTSSTDPNGHITRYTYNADNEPIKITRGDGTTMAYDYDPNGNQTAQTDGAGNTTSYGYDPLDRLISATDPLHRTTSYGYDNAGNRTSLTDPSGRTTNFGYDQANQLTDITYSDGKTPNVSYRYDANGRRTSMADGTGTTTYTYDSLNRVTKSTNGAGDTVAYDYDLAGQLTSLTYPNGKTVSRTYDPAGRLSTVADWLGNTTSFDHDPDANLTAETYPNGVQTSATFNNADQLTSIAHQKGTTTLANFDYTRDNLGQLTSSTPTGVPGGPESYSYTQLNQLASLNSKPYGYDHADNLIKLADGTTQSFDAANQLISSTPPTSGPSSPVVDQVVSGDQKTASTKLTSPIVKTTAGNELVLAFVSADGPKGSTQKIAKVTGGGLTWSLAARANDGRGTAEVWQAYATAPISTAVTATLGNGQFDGSITVATFIGAASTVGAKAARTANRASAPSVTLKTTKAGSLVWATGHDWDHAATITPLGGQSLVHQFRDTRVDRTYWSQRTTEAVVSSGKVVTIGDSAPTTDRWELAAVEIPPSSDTTASGSPTNYTYDKQGNRTEISPSNGTTTALAYDQANRLISYGTTASYTYNGDGLRMSKTVRGTSSAFAWDQSGPLPLLLADNADYYVYGPGGLPIEKISGTEVTYLHRDQQGSTRLLTNSAGTTVGNYTYDPYGKTIGHTGSVTSALQYNGQYTDDETGYQYLRARYYDPTTGQFLTVDPAYDLTTSRYSYATGNPLNISDPSGELPTIAIGAILGGVAGVGVGAGTYLATHWNSGFNAQDLGAAALGGGVSGTITGACLGTGVGLLGSGICGAAGGALGESVSQALDTDPHFEWTDVGAATAIGAGSGLLSWALAPAINRGWLALANRNPGGLGAQNLLPWATTGRLGSLLHENTRIGAEIDALLGLIKGIGSRLKYNGPNGQVC